MFHAISAFSDTGLGIYDSGNLNIAGKLITIALMFLGRLGPVSFFTLISVLPKRKNETHSKIDYVEGKLIL
jgi:Trk-type K+ transport system membrane component